MGVRLAKQVEGVAQTPWLANSPDPLASQQPATKRNLRAHHGMKPSQATSLVRHRYNLSPRATLL